MRRRTLKLTAQQRTELEDMRDHADKLYLRERAAAILKIADGQAPYLVACFGLLKRRKPDTVYGWLNRYEAEGIQGLYIRPGRGRKAVFFPRDPDAACDEVEWVLHQSPTCPHVSTWLLGSFRRHRSPLQVGHQDARAL